MIQIPPGFNIAQYISDLVTLALPFIGVAVLITAGVIVIKGLKKVPK